MGVNFFAEYLTKNGYAGAQKFFLNNLLSDNISYEMNGGEEIDRLTLK